MKIDNIFAEPILTLQRGIDSEKVSEQALMLLDERESTLRSGMGATSKRHDITPDTLQRKDIPELQEVLSAIQAGIGLYTDQLGMKPLAITYMWINFNSKGDYNERHAHPGSVISGAFYIKSPNDSDSPFILYKDRAASDYNWAQAWKEEAPTQYWDQIRIPAEDGKLIMFPAYLQHEVPPNRSDDMRISISFNTQVINEADSSQS